MPYAVNISTRFILIKAGKSGIKGDKKATKIFDYTKTIMSKEKTYI